jgi:hypothetical protein
MRRSDWGWLALVAGAAAYEFTAPADDLLSHAVDRYLEAHPWLVRGLVCVTAAHLINALPPRFDPFTRFGR